MKLLAVILLIISGLTLPSKGQEPAKVRLLNTLRWSYPSMRYELDGSKISVKRNHYVEVALSPGEHTIRSRKDRPMPFRIEAGEIVYFDVTEMALGWGGFRLTRLPKESGEFEIGHLKAQQLKMPH